MKIQRHTGSEESLILTGMIVSDRILAKISQRIIDRRPFRSKWTCLVANWCKDYFTKYQKAPRRHIESLFQEYAQKSQDSEAVELVEKFLATLSDRYKTLSKELNEDHLIDTAARFFDTIQLERLSEGIAEDLENREVEKARERIHTFRPSDLSTTSFVQVLQDKEMIREVIERSEDETLIQYPKALGEFFGPHLQRDGFISFLAPEKRGKSMWLLDLAWRAAVRNRRRTLFYSVGDMSLKQVMRRLYVRAAGRPIGEGIVKKPIRIGVAGGEVKLKSKATEYKEGLTASEIGEALDLICRKTASGDLPLLKVKSVSDTTIAEIRQDLKELAWEGWTPDVVVVDYADNLSPEPGSAKLDYRHRINETWRAFRKLTQDYHCLGVTASQSDAASYDSKTLSRSNFSEDKRKLAHVTGMVGINQTQEEKARGIYRLNWILLREGAYLEGKCVTVAGCLAVANPAIVSSW